jgi:hypothetical protein
MKRFIVTLALLLISINVSKAGNKLKSSEELKQIADSIMQEGFRLYYSELASWLGTDVMMENQHLLSDTVGGYFSYASDSRFNCIFINKSDPPEVIFQVSFDSTFSFETVKIDTSRRYMNFYESDLLKMRQKSQAAIESDTFFKRHEYTTFNLIPVIDGDLRKVYVLTGHSLEGIIILGNDYEIIFDDEFEISQKNVIHDQLIVHKFDDNTDSLGNPQDVWHIHKDGQSEFLSPTDFCTLLLYNKMAEWRNYYVYSRDYLSILDLEKESLFIISNKVMDKIYKQNKN